MVPDFAMWKGIQLASFPYTAQVLSLFLICIWDYVSVIEIQ